MKVPLSVAERSTGSAKSKNETIDSLLQDNDQVELFGSVLWSQCFQIVTKDSSNSSESMDISSRQWYEKSRMLYLLITRSSEYLRNLQLIFGTESLTQGQSAIGAELTQKVYNAFVQASARFKQQHVPHMVPIDVRNMPSEGLAKIRHVGAWAIKKVLSNQRKYVKDNLGTVVPSTLKSVNDRLEMCCLIEDNLIADYAKLKETTSYSETLEVTEDRQYRNRGLSHIKDQVYEFIIELEVSRVRNINDTKLKELKANLVDQAITTLSDREELQEKWMSCFSLKTIDEKKSIIKIMMMVIEKYVRMGAGQYFKDFVRAHRIEKTSEHRKKVLQKKNALEEKKASIPFSQIKEDDSPEKIRSHQQLQDFVRKYDEPAFVKAYNKKELLVLCRAYGVGSINSKTTKVNMVKKLIPEIQSHAQIPNRRFLDNM
ncbi:ATP-dependent DNA helicase PIF1 [Paramuricea clavata]|uniref:ATP-dependent DNA helicase PIF1 n=1 Tax=Paramuricea clavata TaxID=317549 RepID=A0A6S7H1V9_PARCT|nr:ATP-dependent DNA helicase PIF1 [Paramuricea clavata]